VRFFDLVDYYKTNFTMINNYNWTIQDLENMYHWEREVYIQLLNGYIEEKKQLAASKQINNQGLFNGRI
jgi:hypothetical protein